ncbi:MAG: acetate kinase [Candidatus Woesearchaeota archaeon]|jgi:acetate kinase
MILVFNVGSSSVKYKLFDKEKVVLSAYYEQIYSTKIRMGVVQKIFYDIKKKNYSISKIGHRVVHGGSMKKSVRITKTIFSKLKKISELAPLHDIPELEVISACAKHFSVPQIAVFDTAFHQTIPDFASAYGIPYALFEKGIKKYGFHGISHKFVSKGIKGKVISCHLGSGCSVTAIKNGKSIDTSMGFTPLDGVLMSTRAGSLDPSIIPYLMRHEKMTPAQITHMLNNESGWYGVSGVSKDLRLVVKSKTKRAKLAIDMFVYRIATKIGSYVAALNGIDTIIFTGGIGERNAQLRKAILSQLTYLGVSIDVTKNKKPTSRISTSRSKVKVLVIPTNEELAIAQEVSTV